MLSPFTPHMAEELWEQLGHEGGIVFVPWPTYDPDVARADEVVIPVQVNGKVRGRITVPADCTEDEIRAAALADPAVESHTHGKTVVKIIVAKGKLVSIVVT
jgi:leucyl-tRNA synthetase